MNELFAKSPSTKSLSYIWHFDLDYPIDYIQTISNKYDLEYRVTTPHPTLNPVRNRHGDLITSTHISITFIQKQKNDYKLLAAMYEFGIQFKPYVGTSKNNKKRSEQIFQIKQTLPYYNHKTKQIEQPNFERASWGYEYEEFYAKYVK